MSKLRLGQITDLHLRRHQPGSAAVLKRRSREMVALLPLALDRFKQEKIDFLAVTGDLLDVPSGMACRSDYYDSPYGGWEGQVREDYRWIKQRLDESRIPYAVLPGNHDMVGPFEEVFADQPAVIDLKQGFKIVKFHDREWAAHVPHRVDRERRRMEAVLAVESGSRQIHLQHYVIHPPCPGDYPYSYHEASDLQHTLVDSGSVLLALSGHYHAGSELVKLGDTCFSVGPAFAEFPHAVRIYDIDASSVSARTIGILDAPTHHQKPCVFLDRDGVINTQESYSTGPGDLELIPGTAEAIVKLRAAGFVVVIVTSQSCVGTGYVTPEVLTEVHDRLCDLLLRETNGNAQSQPDLIVASHGAGDAAVHPQWQDTSWVKPSPAMLEHARDLLGFRKDGAWMVGDRVTDCQAAENYGAKFILVRTGRGRKSEARLERNGTQGVIVVDTLADAVGRIMA